MAPWDVHVTVFHVGNHSLETSVADSLILLNTTLPCLHKSWCSCQHSSWEVNISAPDTGHVNIVLVSSLEANAGMEP
jgi:hypothetical protein